MSGNAKTEIMRAKFSRSQEKALVKLLLEGALGSSLPTADPLKAGQFWSNAGVVTVSAG